MSKKDLMVTIAFASFSFYAYFINEDTFILLDNFPIKITPNMDIVTYTDIFT